jgi:hypothetical protein
MNTSNLLIGIILLLISIIVLLWKRTPLLINSSLPNSIDIQGAIHPYATDLRFRPLHFGYHERIGPLHVGHRFR